MYDGRRLWEATWSSVREVMPDPALAELTSAVERFRAVPPEPREPRELRADLVQLHHLRDLIDLEIAQRAREFAELDEAEWQGSGHPAMWIRHNCHTSASSAYRSLCVGDRMGCLAASTGAVEAGDIGFEHLHLIASTDRAVNGDTPESKVTEDVLLDAARGQSVSRFRFECAHIRHAADAAAFLAEHVDLAEARKLEISDGQNGAVLLQGCFDPAGAATIRSALEPLARRAGADDMRARDKRLADALVELSAHVLDAGTLPVRNGVRPHVQVTVSVATLTGSEGAPAAVMEFAGPVPAATAQRATCDAGIRRVVFDAKSAVVDVGRSARVPAGPTRSALVARDGACAWPGCDRSAAWTSAHHVRHWAKGGDTNMQNLVLLCYRHHWLVHEGGWELAVDGDGKPTVIAPVPRKPLFDESRAPDLPAA